MDLGNVPARFLGDASPGSSAQVDREALLRETHQLARDLGYIGFRDQYFNDPDSIAEWLAANAVRYGYPLTWLDDSDDWAPEEKTTVQREKAHKQARKRARE